LVLASGIKRTQPFIRLPGESPLFIAREEHVLGFICIKPKPVSVFLLPDPFPLLRRQPIPKPIFPFHPVINLARLIPIPIPPVVLPVPSVLIQAIKFTATIVNVLAVRVEPVDYVTGGPSCHRYTYLMLPLEGCHRFPFSRTDSGLLGTLLPA
jgi:hypothetical protein